MSNKGVLAVLLKEGSVVGMMSIMATLVQKNDLGKLNDFGVGLMLGDEGKKKI